MGQHVYCYNEAPAYPNDVSLKVRYKAAYGAGPDEREPLSGDQDRLGAVGGIGAGAVNRKKLLRGRVGHHFSLDVLLRSKHRSIDDSQYGHSDQSDTPWEREWRPIGQTPIDDSQYGPCNQSDTPRECQP